MKLVLKNISWGIEKKGMEQTIHVEAIRVTGAVLEGQLSGEWVPLVMYEREMLRWISTQSHLVYTEFEIIP